MNELSAATRARLELGKQLEWIERNRVGPAGEKPVVVLDHRQARDLCAAYDALHAAQAQAAPVLAAVEAWFVDSTTERRLTGTLLDEAVAAWRAARWRRCSTPDCAAAGMYEDQDGDWRCGPHMPRGPLSPAERRAIEEGFDEWHNLTLAERERWAYATIVRLLDAAGEG